MKIWPNIFSFIPFFSFSAVASENQNFLAYQVTSLDQFETVYLLGTVHSGLESAYAHCLEERYGSFFDMANPSLIQFELAFDEMDAVLGLSHAHVYSSTEGYIYHQAKFRAIALSQNGLESYAQQLVLLKNPLRYLGQFFHMSFYSKALLDAPYFMHLLSFVLNKKMLFTWGPLGYQKFINSAPRSYIMAFWQIQGLVDIVIESLSNRIWSKNNANDLSDILSQHIEGRNIFKDSLKAYRANAVIASDMRSSIWYNQFIKPQLNTECVDNYLFRRNIFLDFLNHKARVVLEAIRPMLKVIGQDIIAPKYRSFEKDEGIKSDNHSLNHEPKECPVPAYYDDSALLYPQNKIVFAIGQNHLQKLLELAQNDGFNVIPIPFTSCKI